MITKLFELRDRATLVPVMATLAESEHDAERWLLARAGLRGGGLVILTGLETLPDRAACDPFYWGGNRTRLVAHKYITEHWHELATGTVIDVEFILGETTAPKASERGEG